MKILVLKVPMIEELQKDKINFKKIVYDTRKKNC